MQSQEAPLPIRQHTVAGRLPTVGYPWTQKLKSHLPRVSLAPRAAKDDRAFY